MKKIYDHHQIAQVISSSRYASLIEELGVEPFLIEYEPDEFLFTPWMEQHLVQIVCGGDAYTYYIRKDGTRYALYRGGDGYLVGELGMYPNAHNNVFTQTERGARCIAFLTPGDLVSVFDSNAFLRFLCQNMASVISSFMQQDATVSSLKERVLEYMRFNCDHGLLKGLQKASFQLHCSVRQLQRIMGAYEAKGIVTKEGRGTYRLANQFLKESSAIKEEHLPKDENFLF